jgi:hypothetical protein
MNDEIKEIAPACQVCLDTGTVTLADGEERKCPRGCPRSEEVSHPIQDERGKQ